jgi:iron complex transport system ATP-binding protein
MKSVEAKNLTFSYCEDEIVIKDITLTFEKKIIHTLVGLNGSGKTTLIKLLAGLLRPNSGVVYLDDMDLNDIDFLTRSKYIAYVRQGIDTGDDHYVKDYLSFGMMNKLSWYQSPTKEHFEIVYETAEKFRILHLLNKKMNELSGGQKQIVMICRAVIQNTEIIILDEPTSALDFKNQSLILRTLKDIVEREEKTIIMSTHNPNHALFLKSKVVLIHEGKIVDSGLANTMIAVDKLRPIYGDSIVYSKSLEYHEVTIL